MQQPLSNKEMDIRKSELFKLFKLFQPPILPNDRLPTLKSVLEYLYHSQSVDSYSIE